MFEYKEYLILVVVFETSKNCRVMDHSILQVMDYAFVIAMGAEIWLRVLAEGLLFTPKVIYI